MLSQWGSPAALPFEPFKFDDEFTLDFGLAEFDRTLFAALPAFPEAVALAPATPDTAGPIPLVPAPTRDDPVAVAPPADI